MLYKNYKRRLERIAKIIDFSKKHKILILSCIGTLLALLIAFSAVRGVITSPIEISAPQIVYGQDVSCDAGALFRNVFFEYKSESDTEWKDGLPEKVGVYSVRGYAKRIFGQRSYTEEVSLTIEPKPVAVKVVDNVLTYGELPTASAELTQGDVFVQEEVKLQYERATGNVAFSVIADSVVIVNEDGEDVTDCYKISTPESIVTVKKKQVTLKVEKADKVYDGEPLVSDKYEIGELAFDDELEISFPISQTNAGATKNEPEYKIVSKSGIDVTDCYSVTENFGELTVSKLPITIKVKDREVVYNATNQTCNDYEIISGKLVDGHVISDFTVVGGRETVGSERVDFNSLCIKDANENDVSFNYEITFNHGEIQILEREITVSIEGQKVYDAQALGLTSADDGVVIEQGSLVDGQVLAVAPVSVNAGAYDHASITYVIKNGDAEVTENYIVNFSNVSLVIDRRDVVFVAGSAVKNYDAEPLTYKAYSKSNLVEGHVPTVVIVGTITDAGSTANIITCDLIKSGDDDVTNNYNITCVDGTLTVNKRKVNVWANVKKEYDDTNNIPEDTLTLNVTKTEDDGTDTEGLYGEQKLTASFEVDSDLLNVGTYDHSVRVIENSIRLVNGNLDNYDVTCFNGKLEIFKRQITVITETGTRVYNAQAQTYEKVRVERLVEWHDVSYKDWCQLTDVDEPVDNTVLIEKIYVNGNEDDVKTGNYVITYDYGEFNITPRKLTGSIYDEKIYDDEVYVKEFNSDYNTGASELNKLVSGHYINVQSDSVNAGVYSLSNGKLLYNKIAYYDVVLGEVDVTRNYDLSEFNVETTINKRDITIHAPDVYKTYNAQPYAEMHYYIETENLVSTHVISAMIRGTYLDVIDKEINLSYVDVETVNITRENGTVVTQNYNVVSTVNGMLEISRREVRIWADVRKTYDDTENIPDSALSIYVYKIEDDGTESEGLYNEQKLGALFDISASSRDVGTHYGSVVALENTAYVTNGSTENYHVIYENGDLIIDARPITVITETGTRVYNGQAQTYEKVRVENLVQWHAIKYSDWLSLTNVDSPVDNFVLVEKIYANGNEDDVKTGNYVITYDYGEFNITPRKLTGSIYDEKIYDDEVYVKEFNSDYDTGASELNRIVSGHYIFVQNFVENIGEYSLANRNLACSIWYYDLELGITNVTDNYNTSDFEILISVLKRDVRVYASDISKLYDGMDYKETVYDLLTDNAVDGHSAQATICAKYNSVRNDNFSFIKDGTVKITREDGTDVTDNYIVIREKGTCEITQRKVTVKVDYVKTYDDTLELKLNDQKVTIKMQNDNDGFDVIEFNGTNAKLCAGQDLTLLVQLTSECIDAGYYAGVVECNVNVGYGTEYLDEFNFPYLNNYDVEVLSGDVTINKRDIRLTMQGASKTYDRTPLTNTNIILENGMDLAYGHAIIVEGEIPSITLVGSIDNDIPFVIKKGTQVKTHNYNVIKTVEELVITKAVLQIRINNRTITYDGKNHTYSDLKYKVVSGLLAGDSVTGLTNYKVNGETIGYLHDVGTYTVTATPVVTTTDSNYDNYNKYYDVKFINGKFTISQSVLDIKTLDIEKTAEITTLDTAMAYNISGVVGAGDDITVIVTGELWAKGTTKNTIQSIIINGTTYNINGDGRYSCGNYDITVKEGTLSYI